MAPPPLELAADIPGSEVPECYLSIITSSAIDIPVNRFRFHVLQDQKGALVFPPAKTAASIWLRLSTFNFCLSCTTVTGIYTKTGGNNSKYSWAGEIFNMPGAASIHIQLLRHPFHEHYSETHNRPMSGIRRFEVIAPWQFLCSVPAPTSSRSGEAVLAPCDRMTFEALEYSVSSIGVRMSEFIEKRGQKT